MKQRDVVKIAAIVALIVANGFMAKELAASPQHCHWTCGHLGWFEGCAAGGNGCGGDCGAMPSEPCLPDTGG